MEFGKKFVWVWKSDFIALTKMRKYHVHAINL